MLGPLSLLLALAPALGAAPEVAKPDLTPFESWFEEGARGNLKIPAAVASAAKTYRYVFVAGFHNERMPGYFARNVKELRAHGVDRRAIHVIAPSSHETFDENFDEVRDKFLDVAKTGPEKLVVIAHSRGACDALAFALRNPDFARDHIHAMFLVQGPFGGSGLADFVTGAGPSMDRSIPWKYRLIAHVLGVVERRSLRRGKLGGLPGLTRDASRDFWRRLLDGHKEAIPVVGPKTYYITSETPAPSLRIFKRAAAWYLRTYVGASDGVVARGDQSLEGFGTVLAVLDAGHTDLTNRFPSSRAAKNYRNALVQCILMTVGQSGADAESMMMHRVSKRSADGPAPTVDTPPSPGQP
ncbi:alpha/beta fold hydrolase [Singulisphaera rosea]